MWYVLWYGNVELGMNGTGLLGGCWVSYHVSVFCLSRTHCWLDVCLIKLVLLSLFFVHFLIVFPLAFVYIDTHLHIPPCCFCMALYASYILVRLHGVWNESFKVRWLVRIYQLGGNQLHNSFHVFGIASLLTCYACLCMSFARLSCFFSIYILLHDIALLESWTSLLRVKGGLVALVGSRLFRLIDREQ